MGLKEIHAYFFLLSSHYRLAHEQNQASCQTTYLKKKMHDILYL